MFLLSALVAAMLATTALGASAQEDGGQYPPAPPDQVTTQFDFDDDGVGQLILRIQNLLAATFASVEAQWGVVLQSKNGGLFVATVNPVFLAQDSMTRTYTTTVDDDGVATFVIDVPEGVEPGTVPAVFSGTDADGNPVTYSLSIEIPAAAVAAPGDGDGVAATGAGITNLMLLAALVVVLGGGALAYAKGRGTKDEEATTQV